jgi:hypothetical protein
VAFLKGGLITSRDPDTVRCSAIMVWLNPAPLEDFPPQFTTEVPQLVVELSPPGDSYSRFMRRMLDYIGFGVPLVWGIEPDEMTVVISRSKRPSYVLEANDEFTEPDTLPDLRLRVRDLFTLPGTPVARSRSVTGKEPR